MKIPQGMTEQTVLSTIERLAIRFAHKFKFGFYDVDDIKQEIYIMGLDALDRYDGRVPLENFLAVHIKNRLKSLKRDKYMRDGYVCTYCNNEQPDCQYCYKRMLKNNAKKHLIEPLDIDGISDESEPNMWNQSDTTLDVMIQEYISLIDKYLNINYRIDYIKMRNGTYVSKNRRQEIETVINNIIGEHKDEER